MTTQRSSLYCILFTVLIAVSACSKKEDRPAPAENTAAPAAGENKTSLPVQSAESKPAEPRQVTFDNVLEVWGSGQKGRAVELMLQMDWASADIFAEGSVFKISEAEFAQMQPAEQQLIRQRADEAAGRIRELLKLMAAQAKQPGADTAKYRQALSALGQRLSNEDHLAVIQLVGKAVTGYVDMQLGSN